MFPIEQETSADITTFLPALSSCLISVFQEMGLNMDRKCKRALRECGERHAVAKCTERQQLGTLTASSSW